MTIPKRKLGTTGVDVSIIGLGGEGVLRTYGYDNEAYALINRALDLGINYCESARAYSGSEAYYGQALRERRGEIFLTSKSHARDRDGALAHLHETLTNMKTDYIDLWQIHDVRSDGEIEEIFGPGGALEAFVQAKEKGQVRFIGITGHHDPRIIRKCIDRFDFDTVLMPVNPAEILYKSFIDEVLPLACEKGMGIIGMKVFLKGFPLRLTWFNSLAPFFRFALSHPIHTAVIGCDSVEQLEENVTFAHAFSPMEGMEKDDLIDTLLPYGRELMYYKP